MTTHRDDFFFIFRYDKNMKCSFCHQLLAFDPQKTPFEVCPSCSKHQRISAHTWVKILTDLDSFSPLKSLPEDKEDPLQFPGYKEKKEAAKRKTTLDESILTGVALINTIPLCIGIMDFNFIGGSLASHTAKKVEQLFLIAKKKRLPVILGLSSGGARMQEGVFSLQAMSRCSGAIAHYQKAGGFLINILTDPVSGGIAASMAFCGDIIISEPNAFIGFAGPRVLKAAGYLVEDQLQTAQTQFSKGFIDRIIPRSFLKDEISFLLKVASTPRIFKKRHKPSRIIQKQTKAISYCINQNKTGEKVSINPSHFVQLARDYRRPNARFYINQLFDHFFELHGDRLTGDDPALIGGIATIEGYSLIIIAQEKGSSPKEIQKCNYAMVKPSGYRKAYRLIELAQQLQIPVITFIDTPGADASPQSEKEGIGKAISDLLALNSELTIPLLSIIIGQGGSGGALALTDGKHILMQENAIFSVIMPEGCAAILFKDKDKTQKAAKLLRLDAYSHLKANLIKGIIPEPPGGSQKEPREAAVILKKVIFNYLKKLKIKHA